MRLVAMASDPRALPCLEAFAAPPHTLLALVTAPDRPKGRGLKTEPSPLGIWAKAGRIRLLQPQDVNDPGILEEIRALGPEAIPVIAYGQKLGPALLALPPLGCLNLHPSLLPRHRGAAPIPRSLLAGDTETGATVFRMVGRMDAGPVLAMRKEPVLPDDDAETLGGRLFALGPRLFQEALAKPASAGEPQDESKATRAPKLSKEEARLDWKEDADSLARKVRAFSPWPVAEANLPSGKILKVWKASPVPDSGSPGEILKGNGLTVACGRGALRLEEVQSPGRGRMSAEDFLRGVRSL